MKKTMLKSTKSFIIAVAVCAGLALGVFSSVSAPDISSKTPINAFWFTEGLY